MGTKWNPRRGCGKVFGRRGGMECGSSCGNIAMQKAIKLESKDWSKKIAIVAARASLKYLLEHEEIICATIETKLQE